MKSIFLVLILVFTCLSCKDTPQEQNNLNEETSDTIQRLTKEQQFLKNRYKRQISANGDSLLAYIPQDSVKVFFTRYGKENPENKVRLITKYGDVEIELFKETPIYRASFIYLVKNKYFNGTLIYRIVKDFVIQGGNSDEMLPSLKRSSSGNYKLPPHFVTGLNHERGSLSSAKEWENNPENWHNPFEFFITINKSPHLDQEHTVFGKVTNGMDVVDIIGKLPTGDGDWPIEDVYIDMEIIK